jgi:hypothetical protein
LPPPTHTPPARPPPSSDLVLAASDHPGEAEAVIYTHVRDRGGCHVLNPLPPRNAFLTGLAGLPPVNEKHGTMENGEQSLNELPVRCARCGRVLARTTAVCNACESELRSSPTSDELRTAASQFVGLHLRQVRFAVLFWLTALLIPISGLLSRSPTIVLSLVVAMLVFMALLVAAGMRLFAFRCPACGKRFHRAFSPAFVRRRCGQCGFQLLEDKD